MVHKIDTENHILTDRNHGILGENIPINQ